MDVREKLVDLFKLQGCWHEPLKYCPMCLAEMDKQESKLVKSRQRRKSNEHIYTRCCSS